MQLARVTGEPVGPAAATGGDADLVALLLGGGSGIAGSAFPATLQAALAEGGATDEALDATDGLAGDPAGSAADLSGTSLDAALAAALALGAALVAPAATATDSAAAREAEAALSAATAAIGDGAAGGAVVGDGLAAATDGAGVAAPAGEKVQATAAGPAAADPSARPPDLDGEAAVRPELEAVGPNPAPGEALIRTAAGEVTPGAALTRDAAGDITAARLTPAAPAHAGPTSVPPHGTSDGGGPVVEAAGATPFSSGGNEEHGLDLGSSDRRQTFAAVEKPASALITTSGVSGEAPPATTTAGGAEAGDATAALPPARPTGTPPEATPPRVERAVHHSGGIEARWGERVAEALRLSAVRGGGEIRLQLEPEGLGHIDVRLHLQSDGVRAVIVAEHESTRALLTSQQHVLQDAFNRSDLRLTGFSVDVGSGDGAATFGQESDTRQDGGAPPSPAAVATGSADPDGAALSAPLAPGRVSVRV